MTAEAPLYEQTEFRLHRDAIDNVMKANPNCGGKLKISERSEDGTVIGTIIYNQPAAAALMHYIDGSLEYAIFINFSRNFLGAVI